MSTIAALHPVNWLRERFLQWRADIAIYRSLREQYKRTLKELSALDRRELDDLGIARSDIAQIARRHAYGN